MESDGMKKFFPLALIVLYVSCIRNEPVLPEIGREKCAHCSMSIVDLRFHSQLLTEKGRRYYFDSIECLRAYEKTNSFPVRSSWVADFEHPKKMIVASEAVYVRSSEIRSPMGQGMLSFSSRERAEIFLKNRAGEIIP